MCSHLLAAYLPDMVLCVSSVVLPQQPWRRCTLLGRNQISGTLGNLPHILQLSRGERKLKSILIWPQWSFLHPTGAPSGTPLTGSDSDPILPFPHLTICALRPSSWTQVYTCVQKRTYLQGRPEKLHLQSSNWEKGVRGNQEACGEEKCAWPS